MNFSKIISKRVLTLDGSAIRKANEYANDIKDPINLTIGQPDFSVPEEIKNSLCRAVKMNKNGYCKTAGIDELKQCILTKKNLKNQDIIMTCGVTGAISLSLLTCFDEGDELLIPDPYFLQYAEIVKLFGIKPIYIDTYPEFKIKLEMIENKITSKTKAIILNSPNNPTGVVIDNDELIKIVQALQNKNIMVFFDEIYSDFNYINSKKINLFDYADNIILLNGYSKSFAMTGWRLGYAIASPVIIERMTRVQGQLYVSPASIVQYAALEAEQQNISSIVEIYKKRNFLIKKMISPKYQLSSSEGSFYFFVKVPEEVGLSATEFCKLAAINRVLLVPGCAFSQKDTHFRLSFCISEDKLKMGISILNNLLEEKKW